MELIAFSASAILLVTNTAVGYNHILAIQPGQNKGLHYQLAKPSMFEHLSTQWNSFSRIDVTREREIFHNNTGNNNNNNTGRSKILAPNSDRCRCRYSCPSMEWFYCRYSMAERIHGLYAI